MKPWIHWLLDFHTGLWPPASLGNYSLQDLFLAKKEVNLSLHVVSHPECEKPKVLRLFSYTVALTS